MGWEQRHGKRYYYRKRRKGGRVISEYIGAGRRAEQIAARDEQAQTQRGKEWARLAEHKRVEETLRQLETLTAALTRATLLAEGYHTHRGEWRKQRHGQKNNAKG